jgi:predicted helicase
MNDELYISDAEVLEFIERQIKTHAICARDFCLRFKLAQLGDLSSEELGRWIAQKNEQEEQYAELAAKKAKLMSRIHEAEVGKRGGK